MIIKNLKTLKHNSLILILCYLLSAIFFTQTAEAATAKEQKGTGVISKEQPITVDADNQQIDIEKDMITFSGNVVAVQDTLKVKANVIIITNMSSQDHQIITATGNPVYFEQAIETNKGPDIVKGNGSKLVYNIKANTLILTGNAVVYKKDSIVKGDEITYNLTENTIKATSGSGNRVHTTINPTQVK